MTRSEWILGCIGRALAAAIIGFLIVLPVGGDEYTAGEYFVVLLYGVLAFPVYLYAVSRVSDRAGRAFRIRAVALALILALPYGVGSLFVFVPEIGAATLCYVLIGLTVERGPA